ncbi:MAG: energy transducer TonB [Rhodobacteraceae bacterium]|nr:MAG: energy transducer TonB [Paracoccaceae bacterium]
MLLWGGAVMTVVAVHAGAVIWVMLDPPVVNAAGPPPAIMVELALINEAIDTEETELSEEIEDSQASEAAEEVKVPEPIPEAMPETEEEREEEPEETPPPEPLEVEHEAEVALPTPPLPIKTLKPKARPQQNSAPVQAAVKARSQQAQQSTRNTAVQSARTTGRTISPAKWQSRLLAHLERHKPRSKGQRGTAYITFSIDAAGNVLSVRLARSSGVSNIDQLALNLVRRASPVPSPPPDVQRTITVPVKFNRR